ncbi:hypothetical protein NIES4103_06360 [Nostoc sp. NIES-4103]|nr:hypothetical protein NIES4103_06360 [Nostoc sp. NIES-4103]
MILRFNQDFHQSYIQGISIHETFNYLNYEEVKKIIKQNTLNPQQQQALLEILESRPTTDAYYQVDYRNTDYYVIRWLRALGSNVEIILPWNLRQEMALEIQKTWYLYK